MHRFEEHIRRNRNHDRSHLNNSFLAENRDYSCTICYRPGPNTPAFNNFWQFYSTNTPAISYTYSTQLNFDALVTQYNNNIQDTIDYYISRIVFSCRYYTIPHSYQLIRQNLINAFVNSNCFEERIASNQPSETTETISPNLSTPEDLSDISDNDNTPTPFENIIIRNAIIRQQEIIPLTTEQDEIEMENPNQNDFRNLTQAINNLLAPLRAQTQAIDRNTNNVGRRETRHIEIQPFCGGNQDPLTWIEDFERMALANGISVARKLQVIPAYLRGEASAWYRTAVMAQNFENWNEDNNPTSFVPRFLEKYRTSVLIDIWANELINY